MDSLRPFERLLYLKVPPKFLDCYFFIGFFINVYNYGVEIGKLVLINLQHKVQIIKRVPPEILKN